MKECFTAVPNLPLRRVSRVIMSDLHPDLCRELSENRITVISPGRIEEIDGSESYHADMIFCHIGGNRLFAAKGLYAESSERLESIGAELLYTDEAPTAKRPCLNVCFAGNTVICNTKTADSAIMRYITGSGKKIVQTNQRYAKCSVAVVSENAVITSDPSIYSGCRKNGTDVLKISPGHIELSGYGYGFIGGTCGLICKDILAFAGNIRLHPDYEDIKSFAANYGVSLLSLSDNILYDIGGIIPVLEYV